MQAHAGAAVVNFSENCDQELLPPYLDTLITKLMMLLQNGQRMVQVSHWVILTDAAPKRFPRGSLFIENLPPHRHCSNRVGSHIATRLANRSLDYLLVSDHGSVDLMESHHRVCAGRGAHSAGKRGRLRKGGL